MSKVQKMIDSARIKLAKRLLKVDLNEKQTTIEDISKEKRDMQIGAIKQMSGGQSSAHPKESFIPQVRLDYNMIQEQLKGQVLVADVRFNKKMGKEHIFDMKIPQEWYVDDPFVQGAVTKLVDFVWADGMKIRSKDPRVEEIGNQFIDDIDLQHHGRVFLRRALVEGTGFMEIGFDDGVPNEVKVLDSATMFIQMNSKGVIEGYTQSVRAVLTNKSASMKPIDFALNEVMHYPFNRITDSPYGFGMVWPLLDALRKKRNFFKDLTVLMERKAAVPYIVTMGQPETNKQPEVMPRDEDISNMQNKLTWLRNFHEWVVPPYVKIDKLDFGDVGDRYIEPIEQCNQELVFGSQTPSVLMGVGSIPEGLAKVQMNAWMKRVETVQEELTTLFEDQLFGPLILASGLNPKDVTVVWGSRSPEEKDKAIRLLLDVIKVTKTKPTTDQFGQEVAATTEQQETFSQDFMQQIEERLRELLEFEDAPPTQESDEDEPQPRQPPSNLKRPVRPNDKGAKPLDENETKETFNSFNIVKFDQAYSTSNCTAHKVHNDNSEGKGSVLELDEDVDIPLREFVGFDFEQYLASIFAYLDSDRFVTRSFTSFKLLPTINDQTGEQDFEEIAASYNLNEIFGKDGVNTIRTVLKEEMRLGNSIRQIANRLNTDMALNSLTRAVRIARTETIRASNEGALDRYVVNDVQEVSWVASTGARTCPYCDAQNGKVLEIGAARENIPSHVGCRCTWIPIVE